MSGVNIPCIFAIAESLQVSEEVCPGLSGLLGAFNQRLASLAHSRWVHTNTSVGSKFSGRSQARVSAGMHGNEVNWPASLGSKGMTYLFRGPSFTCVWVYGAQCMYPKDNDQWLSAWAACWNHGGIEAGSWAPPQAPG